MVGSLDLAGHGRVRSRKRATELVVIWQFVFEDDTVLVQRGDTCSIVIFDFNGVVFASPAGF